MMLDRHRQRPGRWTLSLTVLICICGPASAQPPEVKTLYLESLNLWSHGADEAAVDALERMRDRVGLPGALLDLDADLGARHPQALIPVLALFDALHLRDIRRVMARDLRATAAASEVRDRLRRLAEIFLRQSRAASGNDPTSAAEAAEEVVSRLWTSVAWSLSEIDVETARQWFDRAHDLDPDNLAASMSIAAIDEKLGDYLLASRHLRKILHKQPRVHEARLRLALSELRSGSHAQADELLAEVAAGDGPQWLRVLAYQERAQALLDRDDRHGALEIVREGRRAAPEDEGLLVLQLWLLGNRSAESVELLAELGERSAGNRTSAKPTAREELSPRARYNLWPYELEVTLRQWRADVDERRELLASALASKGGPDG